VGDLTRTEAAERAGVDLDEVSRLIEAGVIAPDPDDRLSAGDVRRVREPPEGRFQLDRAG
jgi:hypothetical protein